MRGLERTPELDAAVVWMFRSFSRVGELVPVVLSILARRLRAGAVLAPLADAEMRARLDRLATSAQGRHQAIADLARDVRFRYFDEPVLEALVGAEYDETERVLDALEADPDGPGREAAIAASRALAAPAAWCAAPPLAGSDRPGVPEGAARGLRPPLLPHPRAARPALRRARRTAAVRRPTTTGRTSTSTSWSPTPSWTGCPSWRGPWPRTSSASRRTGRSSSTWPPGGPGRTGASTRPPRRWSELLAACDFGCEPWRLDVTVTTHRGRGGRALPHPAPELPAAKAGGGLVEDLLYRNLHPMLAKRLDLWRLANFRLERLASAEDVYLFHGVAHENPKDHRLFALAEVRDLTPVARRAGARRTPGSDGWGCRRWPRCARRSPTFPPRERPDGEPDRALRPAACGTSRASPGRAWPARSRRWREGADLEKVLLRVRIPEPDGSAARRGPRRAGGRRPRRHGAGAAAGQRAGAAAHAVPAEGAGRPALRRALPVRDHPDADAAPGASAEFPPGTFVEHDLDADGDLEPVDREPGLNTANVVVGLLTNRTAKVPEGMTRVALLSDPTRGLGNLAEPECRRILAALDLAERMQVPVEWFTVSSGALIAMDSGTENMDWIADVLRGLIEFTQRGGEINIVVTGINVGGQPYWNAEATMLMHTRGILVMLPTSAMVLTGKQALDFSGGVSAEDNLGIGGYDRVMGPNGQAQYWAPDPRGRLPHPAAALRPHLRGSGGALPAPGGDARPGRPRRTDARRTRP